jgi:hypothetical protein
MRAVEIDPAELGPGQALIVENVLAILPSVTWLGRWHRYDDSGPGHEDGAGWRSLEEAFAWASCRAPVIRVAPDEPAGLDDLDSPWHAVDVRPEAEPARREAGFGGTVVLARRQPYLWSGETFSAFRHDGDHHARAAFTDVDEAIDWARETTQVVVVGFYADGGYDRFSAGAGDTEEDLPRLRAADGGPLRWTGEASASSSALSPPEIAAVADDVLADARFESVEVLSRVEEEHDGGWASLSLTLQISSDRYGAAATLAEAIQMELSSGIARGERPEAERLIFIVAHRSGRWVEPARPS